MKKVLAWVLSCVLLCTVIPFAGVFVAGAQTAPESLKILCLGNSFAVDTMEHVANIAKSLGVKDIKLGTLYIGGCSINKHYNNAINNNASYEYFVNTGDGWTSTYNHAIRATIESEDWDWISIQHGTADGSRYAEEASYVNLPNLISYIRQYASSSTRIAFNMTWVGEKGSHEELINSFGNDQTAYYNAITALTRDLIVPMEGIDRVSPTGTAVQNARTAELGILTRDNYHLNLNIGRYIAGLTFFKALTGADISGIEWAPANTTTYMKQAAVESANNAIATPFAVTESVLEVPVFEWPDYLDYGKAATPEEPFFTHAAKSAPVVNSKVDLLSLFQHGTDHPIVSSTMQSPNNLNKSIDLTKTPYLYYSFAVPEGSDFTFSIYSNSNYAPWFSYLDAGEGDLVLSETAEEWDEDFATRAQYAKTSQTGCIDMRKYAKGDKLQWIITMMKFYAPKGDSVIVSYFFFGSEAVSRAFEEGETLLPTSASQLKQVDGQADITINADGSLTLARGADSAVAWPSVKNVCSRAIDLSVTPWLHLKMKVANGGCGNGTLTFTLEDGTVQRLQLSAIDHGTAVDFTTDIDLYLDLSEALQTRETVMLENYTLSVYGVVGASVTWEAFAFGGEPAPDVMMGDVNGDGEMSTADARTVLLYTVGAQELTDAQMKAADVNGDGGVSTLDAREILMQILMQ